MKKVILLAFALCAVFLWVGTAFADNITVWDQRSVDADWHRAIEDQEVEPGMQHGQEWDLEAFLLEGNNLSMVGGYDFVNGYGGMKSGDIFIDTDLTALYGNAADGYDIDKVGWDYAIHVNWGALSYEVYSLAGAVVGNFEDVEGYNSPHSSPWKYIPAVDPIAGAGGTFSHTSGWTDGQTGFLGGTHFIATGFDLSFLYDLGYDEFLVKFTMECGNDNLIGKHSVPEPATMLLLGIGLISVASFGRKKLKTK